MLNFEEAVLHLFINIKQRRNSIAHFYKYQTTHKFELRIIIDYTFTHNSHNNNNYFALKWTKVYTQK